MNNGKVAVTSIAGTRRLWASLVLRIVLPSVAGVLLLAAAMFGIVLPRVEAHLMDGKREGIRALTQAVCAKLKAFERQVQAGELDRRGAQQQAMSMIRDMRYGAEEKDYFWIMDTSVHMLMHPYRQDLVGRDLTTEVDPEGSPIFRHFVDLALGKGGGYVGYVFQWKDDRARISPKISYVQLFQPWGWVVGTGVYTDDVAAQIHAVSDNVAWAVGVVLAVMTVLSGSVVWSSCQSEYRRRKAEAEVVRLNESLERRIEERTLDLARVNGRLRTEVDERREAQRTLALTLKHQLQINELRQDLLGTGTMTEKLMRITDTATDVFRIECARIWIAKDWESRDPDRVQSGLTGVPGLHGGDTPCLRLAAESGSCDAGEVEGTGEHERQSHDHLVCVSECLGHLGEGSESSVLINDMVNDPRIGNHEWAMAHGFVSCAAFQLRPPGGEIVGILAGWSKQPISPEGHAALESLADTATRVILTARADAAQRQLSQQLAQSQRLESVGQLAAGIAHEINTPTQFVSDNIRFLRGAFPKLLDLLGQYQRLADASRSRTVDSACLDDLASSIKKVKLDYLLEQIPEAMADSLEGLERVTKIVRAMKDFSHPSQDKMASADLNKAVESTVTVARNEWKYVADMTLNLAPDLPPVTCKGGDINQVILNLVVNAAHAIKAAGKGESAKGLITITTRQCDDTVEIRVGDTGTGIAPEHRDKVFDHFFTTKPVGEGTGQGLSFARRVIVEQHGGSLTFETEVGVGTTFIIRLPIQRKGDARTESSGSPVAVLA